MENLNIGEKLRLLRKTVPLTTKELAERVNVSQSYISRFENNRAIPDVDMLAKILEALGTDLTSFFSHDVNELTDDYIQLINTAKTLSREERIKLNEFLKVMKGSYQ
ncbi:hypothetical protein GCM10011391_02940 [Pullulanibacillus camelliae]|uniref:HTH cro/C1-type domain-containing protein n=1 Tax=Pullulanibacillus camelliae TaxID=1707096 RepID=A0A8J2VJT8_9BACL|nr:helix-turn-helix transcriptional regulator [Pullulanibacillus camelliae]GGE27869.1 hypothetical protein GCM10011391_02940 [Pullulanibacillus camelliae]